MSSTELNAMKKSKQQPNPKPESGKKMEKDSSESLKVAVEADPVDLGKLDPDLYGDGPQGPLRGMEGQLVRIMWGKSCICCILESLGPY